MPILTSIQYAALVVLLATAIPVHGEESVCFEVVGGLGHLTGNMQVPGYFCDGWAANYSHRLPFDYDFTHIGVTTRSNLLGCCGIHYHNSGPVFTNDIAGAGTYVSILSLAVPGEICAASTFLSGVPSCFDVRQERFPEVWDFGALPSKVQWVTTLERNSNSIPVAVWSVKDRTGLRAGNGLLKGHHRLPADGMSQAIATVVNTEEDVVFQFNGDPLGCTLTRTPQGTVLTASTNLGTVQVTAQLTDTDPCLERDFYFDLRSPCGPCPNCSPGADVDARLGSVDIRIGLGPGRSGLGQAFLQVRAEQPTTDLGTPALLRCNFIQPDLQTITSSSGTLRQLRVMDGFADILTNSASSYSIHFYHPTNLIGFTNGLYTFTNTPDRSVSVELVGGDTNHVRITESQGSVLSDYYWENNGWTLETGGGLRRELRSVTVNGDKRTETTTLQRTGGPIERQRMEVRQTRSFGDRLIQEVLGVGESTRTNTYAYDSNGLLEQVLRWDGSWDIYQYDSLGRQIEHYRPFLNCPPTTNASLCRRVARTYTNSVVSGSGDDSDFDKFMPRRVIDYLQGTEISRRYTVVKPNERREILCPNPGAPWNDTNNLVTITYLRTDSAYYGQPAIIVNPDGTASFISYTRGALPGTTTPAYEKTTVRSGEPNAGMTDIVQGTEEETWMDKAGRMIYQLERDIESGLLTRREIHTRDNQGRVRFINYLDGTMESRDYDCCHLLSSTRRDGTVTRHTYDALDRQLTLTRDGITTSNVWNSAGDLAARYRLGTNGSVIRMAASGYDSIGRLLSSTNALGEVTRFTEVTDAAGQVIRTTRNTDDSTVIEVYARDGALLKREGTAVFGTRYTNGVVSMGGHARFFTEEIGRLTNGNDSPEWQRTLHDGLGRTVQTERSGGATNTVAYHSTGQIQSVTDADGVTTLYAYDRLGAIEYGALDVDRDGVMDLNGIDRVVRKVTTVTNSTTYNADARLTQTYVYATDNDSTATLLSERADSLYDQRTWVTTDGLTRSSALTYPGNGVTRVTRTAPDGTQVISTFQSSRPLSVIVSNATEGILRQETYGYDAYNRRNSTTDLRTGTTHFTFDDLDRLLTVTRPAAAPGQSPQITTRIFNDAGRVERRQAADGLWTTNEFHVHGLIRKVTGARTYPVEYTYDHAGRLETMKTWQDYARNNGAATTTWKYDERGLLTNKLDAAGKGPSYSHTAAGRLATRTWARTVGSQPLATLYSYNTAGDLETVDYPDDTPDVSYTYDRLGRPRHIEGTTTNDYRFTPHGRLLDEDIVNQDWNYISQTRLGYDALRRRSELTNLTLGLTHTYGYDAASRLGTVSTVDGGLKADAGYSYLSSSPLLDTVILRRDGTTRLTTDRHYDNLNRLTAIDSPSSSFSYQYNQANQRTAVTNANASYWLYGYDRLGQVIYGWRYWADGSHVQGQTFNYVFDDIGNRKRTETGGDENGANLRSASYSANLLNQYTNRTVPGYIEISGTATNSATVMVNGVNASRQGDYFREEMVISNTSAALVQWLSTVATNANGTTTVTRLTYVPQTPETSTHDDDGNLTSDGLWDYTWDAENRLRRIELQTNTITDSAYWQRIDCDYDYRSRRLRKRVLGWDTNAENYALTRSIRYFYDGWNLVGQMDEVTGRRLSFLWGMDLSGTFQGAGGVGALLAMIVHNSPDAGTYFYSYDGNGNVAGLVNAADGTEAARYEYGPFGELLRATGPLAHLNPFRFSTKYQDEETALIYYGYRYYTATTGRWLNADPLGHAAGANLFGMIRNDAVNSVDFQGLILCAFDGTGNDASKDRFLRFSGRSDKGGAPTNIKVMTDLYRGAKIYKWGVGTRTDKVAGNLFGKGMGERLDDTMALLKNYLESHPDEPVDIIGFSRGAAAARIFANRVREELPCAKIRFLGLFDTVAQIGVPNAHNYQYGYDLTVHPDQIGSIAHAVAKNEYRSLFPLTSISSDYQRSLLSAALHGRSYGPDGLTEIRGDNYWEKPFMGAHSDIGGGYQNGRNMDALRWVISEGQAAGAPFKGVEQYEFVRKLKDISKPHDSRYPLLDRLPWTSIGSHERVVFPGNL